MLLWGAKQYCGKQLEQYTIERLIGSGRYSVCFYAKTADGKEVAIKKFRPGIFQKNEKKNIYEAVILSKLKDKRIPEFLGVIKRKCFYCFVLEYKHGHTLKDLIFKHGYQFTNQEVHNIGCQLIKVIRYLHENGVVHRDIRIPNVLLHNGEVYLVDFGLARWADDNKYPYNLDFSFLGDLLLYLLYSSYENGVKSKQLPWYEELRLTCKQRVFLKKLLGLEPIYKNISDIEIDFTSAFQGEPSGNL